MINRNQSVNQSVNQLSNQSFWSKGYSGLISDIIILTLL